MSTIALCGLACSGLGCAGFGLFGSEDPPPLPATVVELRAAIQAERARLKDLVREPSDDREQANPDVDELIAIAKHLSRLQTALSEFERLGPETPNDAAQP